MAERRWPRGVTLGTPAGAVQQRRARAVCSPGEVLHHVLRSWKGLGSSSQAFGTLPLFFSSRAVPHSGGGTARAGYPGRMRPQQRCWSWGCSRAELLGGGSGVPCPGWGQGSAAMCLPVPTAAPHLGAAQPGPNVFETATPLLMPGFYPRLLHEDVMTPLPTPSPVKSTTEAFGSERQN